MDAPQSSPGPKCSQCGAPLAPGAVACAKCGAAISPAATDVGASQPPTDALPAPPQAASGLTASRNVIEKGGSAEASPSRIPPTASWSLDEAPANAATAGASSVGPTFRFSLLGLMGLVTVIAVALGIGVASPGLGIPLGILATPALIRVSLAMSRRRAAGLPVTAEMRIIAFFRSLGLMLIVSIAASVAFVIVCFPVGLMALDARGETGFFFAIIMGIGASLATVVFLLVKFGPLKRYERLYPWADPDALLGEPWRRYPQPTKLPPPLTMEPPPTSPTVPPERAAPPAPSPPEPERKDDATA
ncbi:MAG: zinc ribbon domain-containing protein [Planctomycetia bacterium]|nr:zinc ribbon domain-containing protein [Planctomycetia bacterium]